MANVAHHLPLLKDASDGVHDAIRAATTHDLVFAVVGHAGSGASRVAQALIEGLRSNGYEAQLVKVSKLIEATVRRLDPTKSAALDAPSWLAKIRALQDGGDWLRKEHFPSFTAALAIKHMHDARRTREDPTKPIAFVLDSLKNPEEVDALRKVYGRSFYLVSVVCGAEVRKARLRTKFKEAPPDEIELLMKRDEADAVSTGQQVRKTIHGADFFVNNHAERPSAGPDPVDEALSRFLQIISGTEVIRPTRDERGIFAAWGASLRSACLSRQVGAAILDSAGEIIATGSNDVPRAGGGLYEEGAGTGPDMRCFNYAKPAEGEPKGFCRSDKSKRELLAEVSSKLRDAGLLSANATDDSVMGALATTSLADLIEFSRAVHAEADAIVSLARTGSGAARQATLYCTTYPCHSCARIIVAAGLREVVYYEPYLKSRALRLHDDAIDEGTMPAPVGARMVRFRLFTGVAPRRFAALFEKRHDLKKDGQVFLPDATGIHTDPIFTKSHVDFEQMIAKLVEDRTSKAAT